MLREDTVVNVEPGAAPEAAPAANAKAKRPRFVQSRTDAAIASIGRRVPAAPSGWNAGAPPLARQQRSPAPSPAGAPGATMRALRPVRAADEIPSAALARAASVNAEHQIVPIPAPCFEPSVMQAMPAPPLPPIPVAPGATRSAPVPDVAANAQGKVIVVFGCRGGAGSTTVAVNTAAALNRAGRSVCIVDLDLQLGDVFVALDLEPETSIAAVAREASTIDAAALKRRLARHDSGIYALSQTGHLEDVDPELAERMPALMSTLADHFDYVIVDGVRDFDDCALAALDMADQIALVLSQDVASVRRAARAITLFRQLGYGDNKLNVVVNRSRQRARVSPAAISNALGLPIAARVRNDYKRATSAFDDGALICDVARGSGIARDLEVVATILAVLAPTRTKRRGLLQLFRRRRPPEKRPEPIALATLTPLTALVGTENS